MKADGRRAETMRDSRAVRLFQKYFQDYRAKGVPPKLAIKWAAEEAERQAAEKWDVKTR